MMLGDPDIVPGMVNDMKEARDAAGTSPVEDPRLVERRHLSQTGAVGLLFHEHVRRSETFDGHFSSLEAARFRTVADNCHNPQRRSKLAGSSRFAIYRRNHLRTGTTC